MLAARSPRGSIVGARQPTPRQQRERSTPQCFLARFSEGTEPNHRGSLTTGAAELLASRAISSAIAGAKSENGGKRTKRTKNGFLRIGQNRKNLVTFGKDRKKDEKTMRELPLSPYQPFCQFSKRFRDDRRERDYRRHVAAASQISAAFRRQEWPISRVPVPSGIS
jgi:hypothetical protein